MSMILFAIIGASIKASAVYWCCYGLFCVFQITKALED